MLELGLYLAECFAHHSAHAGWNFPSCFLQFISAVWASSILIKAKAIAEWISDKLDE